MHITLGESDINRLRLLRRIDLRGGCQDRVAIRFDRDLALGIEDRSDTLELFIRERSVAIQLVGGNRPPALHRLAVLLDRLLLGVVGCGQPTNPGEERTQNQDDPHKLFHGQPPEKMVDRLFPVVIVEPSATERAAFTVEPQAYSTGSKLRRARAVCGRV